jgi:hypothetical protein
MTPTHYRIADRFSEPSSWIGVGVAALAATLPALVPPSTWSNAAEFLQVALGTALFFLPDNRFVTAAQSAFAELETALPADYALPLQPVPTHPVQPAPPAGETANLGQAVITPDPAKTGQSGFASVKAMVGMIVLGGGLLLAGFLSACSPQSVQSGVASANGAVSTGAQDVLTVVNAACADIAPIAGIASAVAPANKAVGNLLTYEQSICLPTGQVVAGAPVDNTTAEWIGGIKAGLQVAANLAPAPTITSPTTPATPTAPAQ